MFWHPCTLLHALVSQAAHAQALASRLTQISRSQFGVLAAVDRKPRQLLHRLSPPCVPTGLSVYPLLTIIILLCGNDCLNIRIHTPQAARLLMRRHHRRATPRQLRAGAPCRPAARPIRDQRPKSLQGASAMIVEAPGTAGCTTHRSA